MDPGGIRKVMIGFGVAGVATTLLEAVWFASWALLPIASAISAGETTVQPRHASLWLRRRDGGYTG